MEELRIFEYFVNGLPHTAQLDERLAKDMGLDWDKHLGAQVQAKPIPARGNPAEKTQEVSAKAKTPRNKAVKPEDK